MVQYRIGRFQRNNQSSYQRWMWGTFEIFLLQFHFHWRRCVKEILGNDLLSGLSPVDGGRWLDNLGRQKMITGDFGLSHVNASEWACIWSQRKAVSGKQTTGQPINRRSLHFHHPQKPTLASRYQHKHRWKLPRLSSFFSIFLSFIHCCSFIEPDISFINDSSAFSLPASW